MKKKYSFILDWLEPVGDSSITGKISYQGVYEINLSNLLLVGS